MVGLVGAGEGRWVWGSGVHREGRSATRAYLGLIGEMPSVNARASLLALTPPTGMPALPDPPQHTQRRDLSLTSTCRRAWSAAASARCRLLVHVEKPPVLSEARRWVS